MAWADPGGGTGGRHVVSQAWKGRRSPFLPGDLFLCRPSSSCAQSSSPSPPTAPRPSPLPLAWPWPSGGDGGNRSAPARVLQPDPGGGPAEGAGRWWLGRAGRVGFQSEPLGRSVERADAAASHGPARRRPPSARPAAAASSHAARPGARGRRHLGHMPLSHAWGHCPGLPEGPSSP
jgi:hypothetical protein